MQSTNNYLNPLRPQYSYLPELVHFPSVCIVFANVVYNNSNKTIFFLLGNKSEHQIRYYKIMIIITGNCMLLYNV